MSTPEAPIRTSTGCHDDSCDEQLSGLVGGDRVEATTVEACGRRELAKQPSKRRRIVRRDRTERFHGD